MKKCHVLENELAKQKGANGFSYVMRVNDVDDVINDVTLGNVQHVAHTLQQITVTIIVWGISAKLITRAPRGTDPSPEYNEHFCY